MVPRPGRLILVHTKPALNNDIYELTKDIKALQAVYSALRVLQCKKEIPKDKYLHKKKKYFDKQES